MIRDKNKLKAIRLLVFTCKPKREIAKECDITEQTLYNWLRDREFNEVLKLESKIYSNFVTSKICKRLNEILIKSFCVIEKCLSSTDEKIRLKSAMDFISAYADFSNNFNVNPELANIIEQSDKIKNSFFDIKDNTFIEEFLNSDLSELLEETELLEEDMIKEIEKKN